MSVEYDAMRVLMLEIVVNKQTENVVTGVFQQE
jgi:hypothetical protein